jgi:hypothetical protein
MFFTVGDGSTLRRNEGDYSPDRFEHQHTSSIVVAPVFVLKWYSTPWTSDVVLNFLFLHLPNQKSTAPAFDRLTGGGCIQCPRDYFAFVA